MATEAELVGLEEATLYSVMVQAVGSEAVGQPSAAELARTFSDGEGWCGHCDC